VVEDEWVSERGEVSFMVLRVLITVGFGHQVGLGTRAAESCKLDTLLVTTEAPVVLTAACSAVSVLQGSCPCTPTYESYTGAGTGR
jgi:hypothetical protein